MSEERGKKLPHLENAVIAEAKITRYLLSAEHPKGSQKAAFFTRFGFSLEEWETLRAVLLEHAGIHEVAKQVESAEGTRYVIEGALNAPDGRRPWVRAVWFVERGDDVPHLVTAYPLGSKTDE